MKGQRRIHIGTSGWHYAHWRGPFYPEDLKAEEYLEYYRRRFRTVEVNNTFYGLPEKETLRQWRSQVSPSFIFSVKASRYITHLKKLKEASKAVSTFLRRVEVLSGALGPVLFQLPPAWRFNPDRLEAFVQELPRGFRYAFEFRDASWFEKETLRILERAGAAFCIYEWAGVLSPKAVTADFVYIRLHGPRKAAYRGHYATRVLAGWAGALSTWSSQGKEIFCYFDNDEKGYAARDALRLRDMVEKK